MQVATLPTAVTCSALRSVPSTSEKHKPQRKTRARKVIESLNSFEFADNFLNQLIDEIVEFKNKNADIEKKLLSNFGAAFDKEEIEELKSKDNLLLKDKIKQKMKLKRSERFELLGDEQSKEIEKRIFLQLIDQNSLV